MKHAIWQIQIVFVANFLINLELVEFLFIIKVKFIALVEFHCILANYVDYW
jgi:hypothetical protein